MALAAAGFSLPASAQLKESVEVEGQYVKEILHPDKLGRLPQRLRLTAPQSDLTYSSQGVPADFVPYPTPIPATNFAANRPSSFPRGYLNLSLGSWLNADLKAGYAIIASPEQSLNLWLRHNSTSLWQPLSDLDIDWKRFSYQEAIGADWSRRLGNFGRLDAGVRYRFGYFNYYGERDAASSVVPPDYPDFLTQTLNDLDLRIGLSDINSSSTGKSGRNRWDVALGVRHFAFRTATRETSLGLDGSFRHQFIKDPADLTAPVSELGIDGKLQWELYDSNSPDAYGNLHLTPHYRWANPHVSLRAGVNVDMTFNADGCDLLDPTTHYSVFHISPDVRFDYSGSRFAAWIHATGGQQLRTLAYLADQNLYCYPRLQSTTPLYVPIDAMVGFRLNPFSGAEIEAGVGYRITRNVGADGWTIPLLYGMPSYLTSRLAVPEDMAATYGLGPARYNLKGIYADASVRYQAGDILDIGANLQYSPQSATAGIFNGDDRPRWILTPHLDLHPVKALTIGVSYEYRGVRNFWTPVVNSIASRASGAGPAVGPTTPSVPGPTVIPEPEATDSQNPVALRLPDITRLNAGVAYTFSNLGAVKGLTLGFEAKNILDRREQLLPLMPSEGLTLNGSVQLLF